MTATPLVPQLRIEPAGPPAASRLAIWNLTVLGLLFGALVVLLWPHWVGNPDLSHGFAAPLLCAWLLHEARSGPPRYIAPTLGAGTAQAALLGTALLALCASGLYAAALDWSHSLVAFTLTAAFTLLAGGSLVGFSSLKIRWVPFNWTSCAAILLWPLCAPLPPGTYSRLTLELQLSITENVLRALHLLGIPAQRHGNIIQLANTSVGVEDACSGIRSLISCVFAALFFSAMLVRSPGARFVLIAAAAPIAIVMNFVRSLGLTLLAHGGIDISGRWHDVTGYAVLVLTAGVLVLVAVTLEGHSRRAEARVAAVRNEAPAPAAPSEEQHPPLAQRTLQVAPALALGVAVGLAAFFVVNTRPSPRSDLPTPDLIAVLPDKIEGWQVQTSEDLYRFSATLQTEHLAQRTYRRLTSAGPQQITVYLAYWRAGQAPVSLVASHTPDACWPGAGWTPVKTRAESETPVVAGRTLARAEARLFRSERFPQHVWFWHLYDGRPIAYRDPYSARELLRIAWRYGFSHNGDQLFVRVSSNQPWATFASEPLIVELFRRLEPLGL